jgi:hypothetical protein
MYIPDLAEKEAYRFVGYLSREHDYPKGNTSDPVFDRLTELVRAAPIAYCGYHECDLESCGLNQAQPELSWRSQAIPRHCSTDILVPDGAVLYRAPALILHYIRAHQYLPPMCFVDAVVRCPDPRSPEYGRAAEDLLE